MRRRGATWHLVHEHVEREAEYFEKMYPLVKDELDRLRQLSPNAEISATQVTFFSDTDPKEINKLLAKPNGRRPNVKLLGSCVVVRVASNNAAVKNRNYVFEAVIGLPSTTAARAQTSGVSNHVHVISDAVLPVVGRTYTLRSAFYSQQNGVDSTCAHCCLKMAMWHLRDGEYQVSASEINRIAEASFVATERSSTFEPSQGLTREQIQAVCNALGAQVFMANYYPEQPAGSRADGADRGASPLPTPYELAYMLVESGLPTLILFESTKDQHLHMLPVVGHTLSVDEWLPHAIGHYPDFPSEVLRGRPHEYISSVEWAPHLIIHDDMMGPYYVMGSDALSSKAAQPGLDGGATSTVGRIRSVIAIVKKDADLHHSPIFAQELGSIFFWSMWSTLKRLGGTVPPEWRERLEHRWDRAKGLHRRNLVLRTQVVTVDQYLWHLTTANDQLRHPAGLMDADAHYLRQHFRDLRITSGWLVEFTLPELFSGNLSKLGEMILPLDWAREDFAMDILRRPEGHPLDQEPPLFRMLGQLLLFKDGKPPHRARIKLGFENSTPLFVRPSVQ
jgi:hypothetical protein